MNRLIDRLNNATAHEAVSTFHDCCGSAKWANRMTELRPFASEVALINAGASIWNNLETDDWLEAFAAHPKIGETKSGDDRFAEWSKDEQAGVSSAGEDVKHKLAAANREYYDKFGFIFIVCATGKTAEEMLDLCTARLANERETEIANAAAEQEKITEIRLRKLFNGPEA